MVFTGSFCIQATDKEGDGMDPYVARRECDGTGKGLEHTNKRQKETYVGNAVEWCVHNVVHIVLTWYEWC